MNLKVGGGDGDKLIYINVIKLGYMYVNCFMVLFWFGDGVGEFF